MGNFESAVIPRHLGKDIIMDRDTNDIEELGVASVETQGEEFPVPEIGGYDLKAGGGISAD